MPQTISTVAKNLMKVALVSCIEVHKITQVLDGSLALIVPNAMVKV